MEWHELPKYNGIQVSQLIYVPVFLRTRSYTYVMYKILLHEKGYASQTCVGQTTYLARCESEEQRCVVLSSWKSNGRI